MRSINELQILQYPKYQINNSATIEPVSVADLKGFLRIENDFENDLLSKIIVSARTLVEEYTKRSLLNQKWKISFNDFAPLNVRLVRGPVTSVESAKFIDASNANVTIPNTAYSLSANNEYLKFNNFYSGKRVEIDYFTGYGAAASDVPEPFKLAIMTLCTRIYERKNESFKIDDSVKPLLDPFRTYEI